MGSTMINHGLPGQFVTCFFSLFYIHMKKINSMIIDICINYHF